MKRIYIQPMTKIAELTLGSTVLSVSPVDENKILQVGSVYDYYDEFSEGMDAHHAL